jgi:subtilisin family serine protease
MKAHLTVKLRNVPGEPVARAPYWVDFIRDKSGSATTLNPAFDREMAGRGLPFWVTREYRPAGATHPNGAGWSRDEAGAGLDRVFRVILQGNSDLPDELVERVRLLPEFESVRPVRVAASDLPEPTPAAPALGMGVRLATDRSREQIGLDRAHVFGRGDPRVTVAVLDTGVNLDHPEVARRVVKRADFVKLDGLDTADFIGDVTDYDDVPEDEVGHGTHVAGIIAGEGLKMPSGVAPECGILAVRVLASMRTADGSVVGAGIPDNINTATKWAVDQGADVINFSLGIRHDGGGLPHEDVVRYALSRGVSVVAASGNDGTQERYYPGALPGVIPVGATDAEGNVANFSSFGAPVWLVAPGTDVFSSFARGSYAMATGTSQASPFVAGAIALLKSQALSRGVRLADADVKEILRQTSDKPGRAAGRTPRAGYGRLNLLDACRLLNHWLGGGGGLRRQAG